MYDGMGRREKKTINSNLTEFLYDGLNPVQETSGAAVLANILPGLGIDEFLTRTDVVAGLTSNFLADALGSAVAVTESSGVVQTEYTYEPFGRTTVSGAGNSNPFQYTGRENDGTGLYHFRARDYHPTLQRFVGEDPPDLNEVRLSLQVDPNDEDTRNLCWTLRYNPELLHPSQFVLNNPLTYTDPTGEIVAPILGGCAIGAGISIGMDILGGRKIDWSDAGIACAIGAISGVGLSGWRWLPNARGFEKAWTKDFRTGWHRLPPGNYPGAGRNLPHYHRRPGIGKHRPYQGGW
jgi:RHS repeat-associated protein